MYNYIHIEYARLLIHKHLYNMYAYAHTVYIHLCLSLYANIAPVAGRSQFFAVDMLEQNIPVTDNITSGSKLFFDCFQVS